MPSPFLTNRMSVTFHQPGADNGSPFVVPGYFAADGDAGNTGAHAGNVWRAHFTPPRTGNWTASVAFVTGDDVAVSRSFPDDGDCGTALPSVHGLSTSFVVTESDKTAPDLRSQGRLQYVGERYLRFQGSGEYFVKAGVSQIGVLLSIGRQLGDLSLGLAVPPDPKCSQSFLQFPGRGNPLACPLSTGAPNALSLPCLFIPLSSMPSALIDSPMYYECRSRLQTDSPENLLGCKHAAGTGSRRGNMHP